MTNRQWRSPEDKVVRLPQTVQPRPGDNGQQLLGAFDPASPFGGFGGDGGDSAPRLAGVDYADDKTPLPTSPDWRDDWENIDHDYTPGPSITLVLVCVAAAIVAAVLGWRVFG